MKVVVAFLCVPFSLQLFVIFTGFNDMSLLARRLCISHGRTALAPLGTLLSAGCRASGRKRDGEGARVKSCGEERVICKGGDLEIAPPQEVQLSANVIDDYQISNMSIGILHGYRQCFPCSSEMTSE